MGLEFKDFEFGFYILMGLEFKDFVGISVVFRRRSRMLSSGSNKASIDDSLVLPAANPNPKFLNPKPQ